MRVNVHDIDPRGPDGLTGSERYQVYERYLRSGSKDTMSFEEYIKKAGTSPAAASDASSGARVIDYNAHRVSFGRNNAAAATVDSKGMTGEEIFAYRQAHGGKYPPGIEARDEQGRRIIDAKPTRTIEYQRRVIGVGGGAR